MVSAHSIIFIIIFIRNSSRKTVGVARKKPRKRRLRGEEIPFLCREDQTLEKVLRGEMPEIAVKPHPEQHLCRHKPDHVRYVYICIYK